MYKLSEVNRHVYLFYVIVSRSTYLVYYLPKLNRKSESVCDVCVDLVSHAFNVTTYVLPSVLNDDDQLALAKEC